MSSIIQFIRKVKANKMCFKEVKFRRKIKYHAQNETF